MPTGLRNAPTTFQALMNSVFRDFIDEFVVIYLDDILISCDSKEDHQRHPRLVLSKLRKLKLYVRERKYEQMRDETEFLGLMIGK